MTQVLKDAQWQNPSEPVKVPSRDLPLVLEALRLPRFEPLELSELKWLWLQVAFLLAMTSAKRLSELHALSVNEVCIKWNLTGTGVAHWTNPSFFPKMLAPDHFKRVIELAAYHPSGVQDEETNSAEMLCPVGTLRHYILVTACFCPSDSLFVCYGRRGDVLSKQRLLQVDS